MTSQRIGARVMTGPHGDLYVILTDLLKFPVRPVTDIQAPPKTNHPRSIVSLPVALKLAVH